MRISVRIFLGYFLVVGLSAWYLLYTAHEKLDPALRQSMEDTLVDAANILAELARDEVKAGTIAQGRFAQSLEDYAARNLNVTIWGVGKQRPNYRIYITDPQGRVLYDSDHLAVGQDYSRWNDVYLTLRGRYGARTTRIDPEDRSTSIMHVAAPIMDAGRLIGVVTVAKPVGAIEPFFRKAFRSLAEAGAAVFACSLLIGLLLSWGLTRALGRLVAYAQAVGRGERVVLPPLGRGEVALLGQALESMRVQLEGKQYVEHYVHHLTHELKSPLAAIRGAAELIEPDMPAADQQRFINHIRNEAARMTGITDRMLGLAQLESRVTAVAREAVPAQALVDDVAASLAGKMAACGVVLHAEVAEGLVLRGEPFLLRQALANLLDNAIDFSPPQGVISLRVWVDSEQHGIRVRDHGSGIPDYALPRIFERFYSLPRPLGGQKSTGLGLPFVREVAALHGGRIVVCNHPEGGAEATLYLPV